MKQKIGFYRKTERSNRELVVLFEEIQKIRAKSMDKDWQNQEFISKLNSLEKSARKEILSMLKNKKLKTADDFLRAADVFHHGPNFKSYMIAVALAAVSNHLGEPWGKNHYAVAVDRLLLSLGMPQHFGSHFIKKNERWQLDIYNPKTTDKERVEYTIEPLSVLKKRVKKMDKVKVWKFSPED